MRIETYLGRSDLFTGLGLQTIERIAKQFKSVQFKAGETVIAEGDRSETYFPIATGEAAAWIYGGGAHRTAFCQSLRTEHFIDYAEIEGIELFAICTDSPLPGLKKELRFNDACYGRNGAIR